VSTRLLGICGYNKKLAVRFSIRHHLRPGSSSISSKSVKASPSWREWRSQPHIPKVTSWNSSACNVHLIIFEVYYAQANEDRPIYILDQLAKHVRKNQKTADPGGLLMEISSRLRPIWLEILDHLRTIDSDASFVVTKIWIHVLGYAFGWNEKSACPRGCSWRGCLLYETDTNKDMFSCAKCHRSRYCDSDCQLR
jgi:hypothetical protein